MKKITVHSFKPNKNTISTACKITKDIPKNHFENILNGSKLMKPRDVQLLFKMIARISEVSYRRGVQQGRIYAERGIFTDQDAHDYRYHINLDLSPDLYPCSYLRTSLRLLSVEYRDYLRNLGIHFITNDVELGSGYILSDAKIIP